MTTDTGKQQGGSPTTKFLPLSASTNGRYIQITATATLGTLCHTAVTGTVRWDKVWLYAANTSTSQMLVTVEFGGVGVANDIMVLVPAQSQANLIYGIPLQNALAVTVFAATTAVINVGGFIEQVLAP